MDLAGGRGLEAETMDAEGGGGGSSGRSSHLRDGVVAGKGYVVEERDAQQHGSRRDKREQQKEVEGIRCVGRLRRGGRGERGFRQTEERERRWGRWGKGTVFLPRPSALVNPPSFTASSFSSPPLRHMLVRLRWQGKFTMPPGRHLVHSGIEGSTEAQASL